MTTKKKSGSAHEQGFTTADIIRMESCEGCGTHYPDTFSGKGARRRGRAPAGVDPILYKAGGWWIYDCCNPDWYDEEMMKGK